jgi:hypothetical protein
VIEKSTVNDSVGITAYKCTTPQKSKIEPSVPKEKYLTAAVTPP